MNWQPLLPIPASPSLHKRLDQHSFFFSFPNAHQPGVWRRKLELPCELSANDSRSFTACRRSMLYALCTARSCCSTSNAVRQRSCAVHLRRAQLVSAHGLCVLPSCLRTHE